MDNIIVHNRVELSLVEKVNVTQDMDPTMVELKKLVVDKKVKVFSQGGDEVLRYQGQFCVPNIDGLREIMLGESHN